MKILCLLLPHFPWHCEVMRHLEFYSRPVVITHAANSQKSILDFSPSFKSLQPGMPLQQALTCCGEVTLLPTDMPYYRSVFTGLLDKLESISPLVEGAELGCVYIGVDGLQLIYPDDEAIIKAMFSIVPEDFVPQIGLAGNKFLAYLATLSCPPGSYRILTGDITTFLKDLPCDVLPVSMKNRQKLHVFGLHTLGHIATLPPGPLLSQFGTEGKKIYELARGCDDTPLYPRLMAENIEESLTLSSVTVSLEAILVALESLLLRVFNRISRNGLGIRSLVVWTRTLNMEHWERTVRFKEPAMDTRAVISRLKLVIEDYPQPGPVEQVGLSITRLGYPRGRQKSLFSEVRAQDSLSEDIRQLELRLGNPQIYKLQEVEPWSRIPERRYTLTPTNR